MRSMAMARRLKYHLNREKKCKFININLEARIHNVSSASPLLRTYDIVDNVSKEEEDKEQHDHGQQTEAPPDQGEYQGVWWRG